jgi:hypothetical protein
MEQIRILKTLGISAKLAGSQKMGESQPHSDIDLHCFVKDPEQSSQIVQKHFNYIFPYSVYRRHDHRDLICNFKYWITLRDDNKIRHVLIDLTFFPIEYQSLYSEIEEFRSQIRNFATSIEYLEKKTAINDQLLNATIRQRIQLLKSLRRLKDNYFDQCLRFYCHFNNQNYRLIKPYFDFDFVGTFIGRIKIK